jgi:hypothetical protein
LPPRGIRVGRKRVAVRAGTEVGAGEAPMIAFLMLKAGFRFIEGLEPKTSAP